MSVTLETKISTPVANYPSIVEFSADIRTIYGADTETLLDQALIAGDLETGVTAVAEEVGGNYVETFTTVWVDQATLDAYLANPSIADERVAAAAQFTIERTTI